MVIDRIPFEEAISEKLLLKSVFDELAPPIQVALKIIYGLPLSKSELPYWAMFQGDVDYDELGYPTRFGSLPYEPREYEDVTAILGRRSHKTGGISAFILVYEALLGGHSKRVGKKQKGRLFLIDQSLEHAEKHILEFVEPIVDSSPLLAKEKVKAANTDGIVFKNRLVIAPGYPNIKIFRGFAIPVIVLDEAGFYYKDKESANPDYEVVRAVEPAMGQFEHRKKVTVSTPWSKEGILWEAVNAGTHGKKIDDPDDRKKYQDLLVLHAPTPAMENPLLDRSWFEKQFRKDPDAYIREILAKFVDSISGLIPESILRQALEGAPKEREALPRPGENGPAPYYVAAIDPAFRHDEFAFTIVHWDNGLVQDYLQTWKPQPKQPLIPSDILDEIAFKLKEYRISVVYSDQYQLESLQQLALLRQFVIVGIDFTKTSKAKIYGSFLTLLKQSKVKLLKSDEQKQQLLQLEKRSLPGGTIAISAPLGKFDDIASALVLATSQCHFIAPVEARTNSEPTAHERIMRQIARMKMSRQSENYA